MSALRLRRHCAMPSKGEQRGEGCTAGGTPLRLTRILGVASGVQRESVAAHQIRRQLLAPAILSACFRNISAQARGLRTSSVMAASNPEEIGSCAQIFFISLSKSLEPQTAHHRFPRAAQIPDLCTYRISAAPFQAAAICFTAIGPCHV